MEPRRERIATDALAHVGVTATPAAGLGGLVAITRSVLCHPTEARIFPGRAQTSGGSRMQARSFHARGPEARDGGAELPCARAGRGTATEGQAGQAAMPSSTGLISDACEGSARTVRPYGPAAATR